MPQQLSHACDYRGAQMGRPNRITDPEYPVKFRLEKLQWVDHDYDSGAAYWGNSGFGNIYHAWGNAAGHEQEVFTRSYNRDEAKREILSMFPNARFYR